MTINPACPICNIELRPEDDQLSGGDYRIIHCPRCGKYEISRSLWDDLPKLLSKEDKRALLSHSVFRMQGRKEIPRLTTYSVESILENELPSLPDQINNLILWLGDNFGPGEKVLKTLGMLQTIMGSKNEAGAGFVIGHLQGRYIENLGHVLYPDIMLAMTGWDYYEQLKRGAVMSRRAFMAMKFNDADLDFIFSNYFKPAVKATGYELYRLDEQPRAGLIDDRLRVEIRTSRFLIADLTHGNQGAYWEAGYAEGLGKPVIYTCEKNQFAIQKTHFDTNHHLTITWDKEDLAKAASELTATIRATLPDEAVLTDLQ